MTPSSRGQIIAGKVFGVAGIAAFEATVLVGFGALIFGVPWGNSPLAVILTLGALVLASTGLGVMLSTLAKTRSQLSALVPVVSTAMAMLGGCYWPVEITPTFMQKIALVIPTGWAMAALKNTVSRGMGVEAVLVPVAALLGMAGGLLRGGADEAQARVGRAAWLLGPQGAPWGTMQGELLRTRGIRLEGERCTTTRTHRI